MKKKLVLAGAGHAHMLTMSRLEHFVEKGHQVTVIGPSDHHYYSGMGPGMLGKTYSAKQIRFAVRELVEKKGGVFLQDTVTGIDPDGQTVHLESGKTVSYDVMSCNLGSHVQTDIIDGDLENIYLVKPIERLLEARKKILELGEDRKLSICIIGGGPSAVEIAGNVWRLAKDAGIPMPAIQVMAGKALMPRHPETIRKRAIASLKNRGIDILDNCKAASIKTGMVTEVSGKTHEPDIIFVATGVRPNRVFKDSGIPTGPDGGMRVNTCLQSTRYENLFGGGDCICFEDSPLDKVGVYAVRQNPVLYQNLMAALDGEALCVFEPGGQYLLIFNLGDGTGILHKWRIGFGGRLAFAVKDYIDKKFMKKFQEM